MANDSKFAPLEAYDMRKRMGRRSYDSRERSTAQQELHGARKKLYSAARNNKRSMVKVSEYGEMSAGSSGTEATPRGGPIQQQMTASTGAVTPSRRILRAKKSGVRSSSMDPRVRQYFEHLQDMQNANNSICDGASKDSECGMSRSMMSPRSDHDVFPRSESHHGDRKCLQLAKRGHSTNQKAAEKAKPGRHGQAFRRDKKQIEMESEMQEAREWQAELRKLHNVVKDEQHHTTRAPRAVLHNKHAPIPVSGQGYAMWKRFGDSAKDAPQFVLEVDVMDLMRQTEDGYVHVLEEENNFEDWVLPIV